MSRLAKEESNSLTNVIGTKLPARSVDLGHIAGLPEKFSRSQTLEIFEKTCINRYFELAAAKVYETGVIKMPIYLSLGQEHVAAAISCVLKRPMIFAQHRAHSYYLSFGGDMGELIDELLHRETGCAKGMGGSASIHAPSIEMYGHSGLMGDQVPIAVGAALGSGKTTITVVGDASAEEDYVYGAMGFAATKKLPVIFLCEDNGLSILTEISVRRSWSIVDVARSLGLHAVNVGDDPWLIAHHVEASLDKLPAFINVNTCRHRWHAGTGTDGLPEWNRFELFKDCLSSLGFEREIEEIEVRVRDAVNKKWEEHLQRQ